MRSVKHTMTLRTPRSSTTGAISGSPPRTGRGDTGFCGRLPYRGGY
jgi:hypothetical protein